MKPTAWTDGDWEKFASIAGQSPVNDNRTHACNCIGPQGGKPLCPCRMRGVRVVDGRYVEVIDLGPVVRSPS